MRIEFNDVWLKKATIKQIKALFKGDKIKINLALERKKQLNK